MEAPKGADKSPTLAPPQLRPDADLIPAPAVAAGDGPFKVTHPKRDGSITLSGGCTSPKTDDKGIGKFEAPLDDSAEAAAVRTHEYAHLSLSEKGYFDEIKIQKLLAAKKVPVDWSQLIFDIPTNLLMERSRLGEHVFNLPLGFSPSHTFITTGGSLANAKKTAAMRHLRLANTKIVARQVGATQAVEDCERIQSDTPKELLTEREREFIDKLVTATASESLIAFQNGDELPTEEFIRKAAELEKLFYSNYLRKSGSSEQSKSKNKKKKEKQRRKQSAKQRRDVESAMSELDNKLEGLNFMLGGSIQPGSEGGVGMPPKKQKLGLLDRLFPPVPPSANTDHCYGNPNTVLSPIDNPYAGGEQIYGTWTPLDKIPISRVLGTRSKKKTKKAMWDNEGNLVKTSTGWGKMKIVDNLEMIKRPKVRLEKRRKAGFIGALIYPFRALLPAGDGQAFGTVTRQEKGTLVLDCSGSMSLTVEEIEAVLNHAPQTTIALYASNPQSNYGGNLVIAAANGKVVKDMFQTHSRGEDLRKFRNKYLGGDNLVDGPALEWLAQQPEPRIWISDGGITGNGTVHYEGLLLECKMIVRKYGIQRFNAVPVWFSKVLGKKKAQDLFGGDGIYADRDEDGYGFDAFAKRKQQVRNEYDEAWVEGGWEQLSDDY